MRISDSRAYAENGLGFDWGGFIRTVTGAINQAVQPSLTPPYAGYPTISTYPPSAQTYRPAPSTMSSLQPYLPYILIGAVLLMARK